MKICKECGNPFEGRKNKVYCSSDCRIRHAHKGYKYKSKGKVKIETKIGGKITMPDYDCDLYFNVDDIFKKTVAMTNKT